MHFVIGLFLLCVILAVPALRAAAFILLLLGGIAVGGLMLWVQQDNVKVAAKLQHGDWLDQVDLTPPTKPTPHGDWIDRLDLTPPAKLAPQSLDTHHRP